MWLPLTMHDVLRPDERILDGRATSWLLMLGRLKPGATLEQAREQVPMLIKREVAASSSPADAKAFIAATSKYYVSDGSKGFSRVRTEFHAPLLTLMTGVALLLCIICANVANLLLARAVARGREMSLRLALGADRSRLVRQLLTESGVLALLSAATGLLVAWWGSRTLLAIASAGSGIQLSLHLDMRVLAFTLAVSIGAVALFGLVPALRAARGDLATMIRSGTGAVTGTPLGFRGRRAPLGMLLVVGQVALSVLLLVGAAMLVRSLRKIESTDIGIDRDHLIIVDVDVTSRGYTGPRVAEFANRLRERLATLPGVAAVTLSENGIFSGTESDATIEVRGFVMRQPSDSLIAYDQVGANYARALGAHLIAGRDIARGDEGVVPRVVLVNQSLARFYFGDTAVGKFLYFNDSIAVQIVGVVADIRDHDLEGTLARRAYFPFVHAEDKHGLDWPGRLRLEVRAAGDPTKLVQPLREAIRAVDPMLPIDGIDPVPVLMRETIVKERLLAKLATAFGVLALVLAAIGLYGVMTYAITRRTSEIGLRVALGAQRGDVVRMVLRDGLGVVVIGVIVGLPLTLACVRLLGTQLHGVSFADPVSIVTAIAVLIVTALVAALVPALRASRVSPIIALRAE
jgi:predicted permease